MADTNNHITEAAKLSQEAYKAAKKDISQTLTGMSGNTRKIFNAAVAKAAHDVNYKGEKAMAEAVQALASQGIYASTHYDKNGKLYRVPADVAVRQAVYTSGRQRFNGQVKDIALKTGKDLIEVNSTANCRPSHEAINGKIFSLSGSDPRYPKMTSDLEALFHDYNCGHQWAIYHEGLERVFEDPLEGTGYTVEEARAAVGKQRRYENSIRKQKRVVEALKAAGQETADANRRLSALQRRLREHIEANKAVCRRERHREQLYDTARRMKKKAQKKITGARSGALNKLNDPDSKRRDAHAERYYQAVRNRDRAIEIETVTKNSGLPSETVEAAYSHLFEKKHMLGGESRYFYADYEIARSWQRLREGKDIKSQDLILLLHEALESEYMSKGLSYDQAHELAQKKYNYAVLVLED